MPSRTRSVRAATAARKGSCWERAVLDGVVLAPPHGGQAELLGQDRLLEALGVEGRVGLAPVAGAQLGPGTEGRWAWHAGNPTLTSPCPDLSPGRAAARLCPD